MLNRILEFSLRQRGFVLLGVIALILVGVWAATRLHVDAVPDITSVQVQINTAVPALAPEEIEMLVTFPIENEMAGLPGMTELRSLSKPGLSQVTMTFVDGTDVYRARQLVTERIQLVLDDLPAGPPPKLAPVSTGLGEIYYYSIGYADDAPNVPETAYEQLLELSQIQEYTIKPLLRATPGLAEVNTSGGYEKQIVVQPDPHRLARAGLSFEELAERIRANMDNAGGGLLEVGREQVVIRSLGRVQEIEQIGSIPVKFGAAASPILVSDLARIEIGSAIRTGASTVDGREAIVGAAIMLAGENSRVAARRVDEKLREIQRKLPPGVLLTTLYDRSDLIHETISTVRRNLTHGAILVIIVLFAMLGNMRAALIVALAIPLSMFFAMLGMVAAGLSANLMSLGAIDFGLIVSGAVIMVENSVRHLALKQETLGRELTPGERAHQVLIASRQVAAPMFFGVLIITVVYVPILALSGIEGKMFQPMALTVMFALIGSLLLALTVGPVLSSMMIRGKLAGGESSSVAALRRLYAPVLNLVLRAPLLVVAMAAGLVALAIFTFSRLGAEFLPQLDEGSLSIQMVRANSVGIQASLDLQRQAERHLLRNFPEISRTFSRIGTAEVATDPMGPNVADTYVLFHPRETWRRIDGRLATKSDLVELMRRELERNVPGQFLLFTQPIQLRFSEIMAGARADMAVKIFGDDFEELERLAFAARDVLRSVPGGGDVEFDAMGRVPMLEIIPKRDVLQRMNLHSEQINTTIRAALAGERAGIFIEGNRRHPVLVRLSEDLRHDFDAIKELPVRAPDGGLVRLGQIADIRLEDRVGNITREMTSRRAVILVNLRGRDTGSFVAEAERKIREQVEFPPGYYFEIGGQYENLQRAKQRLMFVVPVALTLIFLLIFTSVGSLRQSLVIYTAIPLAVTGGVFSLWLREMPFSISAGVGFIALSGIAVMDALVLVTCFNDLRREGFPIPQAVRNGARNRLRPVLMTSLVAGLGFVPMAFATTIGAEMQRPLATVVIGGVVSSTFLTLLVLPALYYWTERQANARRHGEGRTPVPAEMIEGKPANRTEPITIKQAEL